MRPSARCGPPAGHDGLRHVTGPATLGSFFAAAADRGARTFLRDERGRLSYGEFWEHGRRLAGTLLEAGYAPGDRVLLVAGNSRWWPVALAGVTSVGLVAALVNPRLTDAELATAMTAVEAAGVLADDAVADRLVANRGGGPPRGVVAFGEDGVTVRGRHQAWNELPSVGDRVRAAMAAVRPEQDCLLQASSGSTGRPKWVAHRHGAVTAKAAVMAFDQGPEDRLLGSIPLYTVFGLMSGLLSTAAAGGELLIRHHFDAQADYRALRDERCTLYNSVRSMMLRILELPEFDAEALVLRGGILGANLTVDLARTLTDRLGIDTYHGGYGATETLGAVLRVTGREMIERGQTVLGAPLPGYEFRIEAPESGVGELWVRSSMLMRGYLDVGDGDQGAGLDADGWWHSGDLVSEDHGMYVFHGRSKEIVRTNSQNISMFEVQEVLAAHPAVERAALVGVPDERVEEVAVAFVVLRPGVTTDAGALVEHCRCRLAAYKVPRCVLIRDSLPLNAHDKVVKPALQEEARAAWAAVRAAGR